MVQKERIWWQTFAFTKRTELQNVLCYGGKLFQKLPPFLAFQMGCNEHFDGN